MGNPSQPHELEVGRYYEITHGPASSPQRTSRAVVEGFDAVTNTYTFRLDDGTRVSLVDDEIDGAREIDPRG